MEKEVIDAVVEEVVKKTVFSGVFLAIKKTLLFVVTFKWFWLLIKRSGRKAFRSKDLTMVQLIYGLWIRIKWFVLGVIGGYLLYYFELFVEFDEWIESVINGLG